MKKEKRIVDFTNGPILGPMMKFMLPVLLALLIQSLYGAVDLLIVGQFGEAYHVSGVSMGGNITHMFTALITAIAMGTTIMLGQFIGEGKRKDAGDVIGTSVFTFIGVAIILARPNPIIEIPVANPF